MSANRNRKTSVAGSLASCAALIVLPLAAYAGNGHAISISTNSLTFGDLTVNLASTPQSVTVANAGNAPLFISSVEVAGDFGQTTSCGSSVPKKKACTISVSFTPRASGYRTGTLTIRDNAPGSPHVISLAGLGVADPGATPKDPEPTPQDPGPAPQDPGPTPQDPSPVPPNSGAPQAQLSPSNLAFGNQVVQTASNGQLVTLVNTGSAPLAISSIGVDGEFAQTGNCGSSLDAGATCTISVTARPASAGSKTGTLTVVDDGPGSPHTVALSSTGVQITAAGNVTAVWANEGGDKVTQDELRASHHTENLTGTVMNRAWDGTRISLSGARNEVVSFNLVLEAANTAANNVTVQFDTLTGPGGATIASSPTSGNGVFNWVGRNIELFFVRYLQIKGLSFFGYFKGDERQIPARFQTPWTGNGSGTGVWTDRPDHDKFYPDIMVPLELSPNFSIAGGNNQSIWSDIYIPKSAPSGIYTGTVSVLEDGVVTHQLPVSLNVQKFVLPDAPTSKTMVNLDTTDIMWRYVTGNGGYANWGSSDGHKIAQITDKYFELFHRHKLSTIGENECPPNDRPCDSALPRLNGSLFTAANGYDGPGVNTPEGVYSIGTYGGWGGATYTVPAWKYDRNLFWNHIDNYANWFHQNLPGTDYFLYLEDEPPASHFGQIETWAEWIAQDPGPGNQMLSLATVDAVTARAYIPSLDVPVSAAGIGSCLNGSPCDPAANMRSAADFYSSTPGRKFWGYNDGRPGTGTAMTEDDGVSMRVIPWTQYKMGIDRWFYWYANVNNPADWFTNAVTWGSVSYYDRSIGQTGSDGTSNGNGLLVYPGSDLGNSGSSYGVNGPFASLRLKEWRRGIQDTDYLALANQIDPTATQAIISQAVPRALWENPAPGGDPSYFIGSISWSSDPDEWEGKRAQLSQIIDNFCAANPGNNFCNAN